MGVDCPGARTLFLVRLGQIDVLHDCKIKIEQLVLFAILQQPDRVGFEVCCVMA